LGYRINIELGLVMSDKYPLREEFEKWLDMEYNNLSRYSMVYAMMYKAYEAGKKSEFVLLADKE